MTELVHDPNLDEIRRQEQRLRFVRFGPDEAWSLGTRLRGMAMEVAAPVVIDVFCAGRTLFHNALEGSVPDNAEWVRRKRNVALRFWKSSYQIRLALAELGVGFTERYGLPETDYAPHGGSVPIILAGTGCIGAVTVSGLPQKEDHAMVIAALEAELGLGPI
ncbi:heme-degrading domain-containing protein [Beijerinckia mobilis]|uniref:heme-degrading domain-containing protein n=1 Tax=Beijerinckia mobilis TaxID=231434 RepID=UPI000557478B|nr:heme-degrading domain-containing protein [Beijerinckia mobilis]